MQLEIYLVWSENIYVQRDDILYIAADWNVYIIQLEDNRIYQCK